MNVLDLFCGEGGMAAGLMQAGHAVTGIDRVNKAKRYPGTFAQGDALEYLRAHGREYDAIVAGPPCQAYSIATAGNLPARAKYDRLIDATRAELNLIGKPWVIENVAQARSEMIHPILLCGRMFGLGAYDLDGEWLTLDRHRLFESSFPMPQPHHPSHERVQVAGVYGGSRRSSKPDAAPADDRAAARDDRNGGYVPRSKDVQQRLLGVDWMTIKGMQESIPPAYGRFIGDRFTDLTGRLDPMTTTQETT